MAFNLDRLHLSKKKLYFIFILNGRRNVNRIPSLWLLDYELFILKLRRFWICHCFCEMRLSIWMCYWTYNGIVVVFQKLSMRSVDCVACKHTKHTHSTKRKYWTSLQAERSSCNWRFHKLLNSRCTNPNDRYVNKNRKAFQICGMINIVNVLSFSLCTRRRFDR